jgi:superfamily I DNA and/or RNA helicase
MLCKRIYWLIVAHHYSCCTLSAAGHEVLSQVELEFPTVIIDEACQCIELR